MKTLFFYFKIFCVKYIRMQYCPDIVQITQFLQNVVLKNFCNRHNEYET